MRIFQILLVLILPIISFCNDLNDRRAMWVVRDALSNENEINKIISTAVSSGITDIFLQVRALGYTYYKSDIEQTAEHVNENFDPLETIIEKALRYKIRIHAWINMFYIWASEQPPLDGDHIFNKYNDYILRKNAFPTYKNIRLSGGEGYFVDPKIEKIQEYLLNLILEISTKYEIAGIHLDYFRYPSVEYSFTPASRTQFILSNYYDPISLYTSSEDLFQEKQFSLYHDGDTEYRKSLMEALSVYIKKISKYLKRVNPYIELSVAVKPNPSEAKHRFFQDWLLWLEENYCDFVVIMNYSAEWEDFKSALDRLEKNANCNRIMVGVSTFNQNVNAVKRKINLIKSTDFAGFCLFSYNHFRNNREYYKNLQLSDTYDMEGGF